MEQFADAASGAPIGQRGAAAIITLGDQTSGQFDAIDAALRRWSRAADVYAVVLRSFGATTGLPLTDAPAQVVDGLTGEVSTVDLLARELTLYWRADCTQKPCVALLDGVVTVPAIGLSAYLTHRVAGDDFELRLPRPDDMGAPPAGGVASLLARLPREQALDWALSGRPIGRAEAYAAGFITHCIARSEFEAIVTGLSEGYPVDPLLDDRHSDPPMRPRPAASIAPATLAGAGVARLISDVRALDRRQALQRAFRLGRALRLLEARAENKFSEAAVDALFAMPETGELSLPTRSDAENGLF